MQNVIQTDIFIFEDPSPCCIVAADIALFYKGKRGTIVMLRNSPTMLELVDSFDEFLVKYQHHMTIRDWMDPPA